MTRSRATSLLVGLLLVGLAVAWRVVPFGVGVTGPALGAVLPLLSVLGGLGWIARGLSGSGLEPSSGTSTVLLKVALAAFLLVAVTGALAALSDPDLPVDALDPLSSQHLFPKLRRLHPTLAATAGMLIGIAVFLAGSSSERPEVTRAAVVAGALFVAQLGVGFVNLAEDAPSSLRLAHGIVALALWTSLVWLVQKAR